MKKRDDRLAPEKIYIRQQLRSVLSRQEGVLKHAIHYGQTEIRDHLKSIESLFVPETKRKSAINTSFNIDITRSKYKEFKRTSRWRRYKRIKELRKALKNLDAINSRQFFRNSEVFRLMLIEIDKYIKSIKGDKHSKKLSRLKGDVGEISKRYILRRRLSAKKLKLDIETANKKIKKKEYLNNIEDYISLFIDFFMQEQERLRAYKLEVIRCINITDEDVVTESIYKENTFGLGLPSWKVFMSNIE